MTNGNRACGLSWMPLGRRRGAAERPSAVSHRHRPPRTATLVTGLETAQAHRRTIGAAKPAAVSHAIRLAVARGETPTPSAPGGRRRPQHLLRRTRPTPAGRTRDVAVAKLQAGRRRLLVAGHPNARIAVSLGSRRWRRGLPGPRRRHHTRKPPGPCPHWVVGIEHDPIHAVVRAGQQIPVPFAEVIGHPPSVGRPTHGARAAPKGPPVAGEVPERA